MQGDEGEKEGEGEIDGGGEGDWGKVCFLYKEKESLNVNLACKQTTLICKVLPSPLTVHTILEIFKETSFSAILWVEMHWPFWCDLLYIIKH